MNLVWWEPDTPATSCTLIKPWTHVPGGQEAQGKAVHRLPVGNVRIFSRPRVVFAGPSHGRGGWEVTRRNRDIGWGKMDHHKHCREMVLGNTFLQL